MLGTACACEPRLGRLTLRGNGKWCLAHGTHLGLFLIHRSTMVTVDRVGRCGLPRSCSGLQAVPLNCTSSILTQPVVADASRQWEEPERGEKDPCNKSPGNDRIVKIEPVRLSGHHTDAAGCFRDTQTESDANAPSPLTQCTELDAPGDHLAQSSEPRCYYMPD